MSESSNAGRATRTRVSPITPSCVSVLSDIRALSRIPALSEVRVPSRSRAPSQISALSDTRGSSRIRALSHVQALCCVLALTLPAATPARADDPPAPPAGSAEIGAQRIKTAGCTTCHGRDGVSRLPEAPNLAGQVQGYLASALQAYHSGERKNEIMNTVAGPLSDDDIANLAAYYSSIKVSVTPPPRPSSPAAP